MNRRLTPYPRPEPFQSEAEKAAACDKLLKFLLKERGMIAAFSASYEAKRLLIRKYQNQRPPNPVPAEILALQDRLFWTESLQRGTVSLESISFDGHGIGQYRGDITQLEIDAVVNAANSALLGCFFPAHTCIDNLLHSYAGMQMRRDCAALIAAQGEEEPCGGAKVTRGYNLPAKYVFHTVGPMITGAVTGVQRASLRSCYTSCLDAAEELGLNGIAFCCISTGVFNFPRAEAAEIATGAVYAWKLRHAQSKLKVVFDTFTEEDSQIYASILKYL